ncbi:hypothetical protein, partial [Yersinia proxima]
ILIRIIMSISNVELASYVIERRIWSLSFFKAKMAHSPEPENSVVILKNISEACEGCINVTCNFIGWSRPKYQVLRRNAVCRNCELV